MGAAIISLSVLLVLVTFGLIGMILWHLLKKPECPKCPNNKVECEACPECPNNQMECEACPECPNDIMECEACPTTKTNNKQCLEKGAQCVGLSFLGTSSDSKQLIKAVSGVLNEFQAIGCSRLTSKEIQAAMNKALDEGLAQIESKGCKQIKAEILDF